MLQWYRYGALHSGDPRRERTRSRHLATSDWEYALFFVASSLLETRTGPQPGQSMEEEIQSLVELQIRAAVAAHLASQDDCSPAPAAAAAVNIAHIAVVRQRSGLRTRTCGLSRRRMSGLSAAICRRVSS